MYVRAMTEKQRGNKVLKTLRFGVEIETIGRGRKVVAEAIRSVVGGRVVHVGTPHCYDPFEVIAEDGRKWTVMADSSLSAPKYHQAEVVTPILKYEDLDTLQEVVRAVRKVGAKTDASCGMHVHTDAAPFTAKAVRNLVKMVNKQEQLIEHALGISAGRRARWCRGINQEFLRRIENDRHLSMPGLNRAWYGYENRQPQHYDFSRYAAVNLHNIWFRGTVEYRWYEASLHAGKVKANVQFSLALSGRAIAARGASSKKREFNKETAKYDFRVFLLSLGLIGDEFKTARLHLMSRLEGSAAWKHGRRDTVAARAAAAATEQQEAAE